MHGCDAGGEEALISELVDCFTLRFLARGRERVVSISSEAEAAWPRRRHEDASAALARGKLCVDHARDYFDVETPAASKMSSNGACAPVETSYETYVATPSRNTNEPPC